RDRVAEHVMNPAQRHRLGGNIEAAVEPAQVMAVARTQDDTVVAERHGAGVAVFGLVVNPEQRGCQAMMGNFGLVIYKVWVPILRAECFFHRQSGWLWTRPT